MPEHDTLTERIQLAVKWMPIGTVLHMEITSEGVRFYSTDRERCLLANEYGLNAETLATAFDGAMTSAIRYPPTAPP